MIGDSDYGTRGFQQGMNALKPLDKSGEMMRDYIVNHCVNGLVRLQRCLTSL